MTETFTASIPAEPFRIALQDYENSLAALVPDNLTLYPESILRVLLARDVVAVEVARHGSPEFSIRLIGLDEQLRNTATEISDSLPENQLEAWRGSFNPGSEAWWWHLDDVSAEISVKRSPWWSVATGLLLTISASLTADIARHFLSNGPDFYGALSTISQGAVTIIAGSTLTKAGRSWINRWLSSFGFRAERRPQVYTALALSVLILVSLFNASLPAIAIHYYDARGRQLFREGKLHSAIEHFQRATSIAPSEYVTHFDLADSLEELLDIDRAIGEYQASIQANPEYYPAYNNLARLYLVKRKDPESALRALRKGILHLQAEMKRHRDKCDKPSERCDALYALHKNFAWVNVENHWYGLARIDVDQAIHANPNLGGIYCLLAQIDVAEGNNDDATRSWGKCIVHAAPQLAGDERNHREDIEERWIAMAQEWELHLKH